MNVADTVTKQVVVLSESAELTALLNRLLARSNWHAAAASPGKAADSCNLADAMVVDLPLAGRAATVAEVRRRFSGPLVVVARHGEGRSGLSDEDYGIVLLTRPFAARDLGAALGIFDTGEKTSRPSALGPAATAAPAMATPRTRTAPCQARPTWLKRAAAGLIASLRDRHRRKVAVGAVILITFLGAFALAAKGSCGPGCTGLADGSPVQVTSATVATPGMTGSEVPQATGSPADAQAPGSDGIQDGVSHLPGATFVTGRRSVATITTQKSDSGSAAAPPTTAPRTTAPPSTAPPTTAPPTTAPPTTAPPTTAPPTTAPPSDT